MSYVPPSVSDLLQETLDRANDALAPNPARRLYVAHGEPPAPIEDCDQLTVHLVRMRAKLTPDSQQVIRKVKVLVWVASLAIVRWHCVPSLTEEGGDPPATDLSAAHKALLADSTGIARHLSRLWITKAWPETVSDCGDVTWNPVEPVAPQGGFAAFRQVIDVQI